MMFVWCPLGCSVWVDTADDTEAWRVVKHLNTFLTPAFEDGLLILCVAAETNRFFVSDFTMLFVFAYLHLCLNLFASFCNCGLSVISSMVLHREFDDGVAFWDCIRWSIKAEAPTSVSKGKKRKTFLLLQFSFLIFLLSCECLIFITRFKVGFPARCCFCLDFFLVKTSFYWM